MYHDLLKDGFGNGVSMLIYFYIDNSFVISNTTRHFWSRIAIKYFKIEKSSEKKNYRGVHYLSGDIPLVEIRQSVPTLRAIEVQSSALLI